MIRVGFVIRKGKHSIHQKGMENAVPRRFQEVWTVTRARVGDRPLYYNLKIIIKAPAFEGVRSPFRNIINPVIEDKERNANSRFAVSNLCQ